MSPLATWWERRYGGKAEFYESVAAQLEAAGIAAVRADLAADLSGAVIEIGCGTGLNFRHYSAAAAVTAIEPDGAFRDFARSRLAGARAPIEIRDGDAQSLGFPDASFDAALTTLVFCSIPDAARALRELRRVVRPGGAVRFLEHVRSPGPVMARLQAVLDPIWCRCMDGCHLQRETVTLIEREGFRVDRVRAHDLGGWAGRMFPIREVWARA